MVSRITPLTVYVKKGFYTYSKDSRGDSTATLELCVDHATGTLAGLQGEARAGSSGGVSSTGSSGVPVSSADEASILFTHGSDGEIAPAREDTGGGGATGGGGGWRFGAAAILWNVSDSSLRTGGWGAAWGCWLDIR